MITINILGAEYTLEYKKREYDIKLNDSDGYCDHTTKEIVVVDLVNEPQDPQTVGNIQAYQDKVFRHELVHAFFFESGLHDYAINETLVDWVAVQLPKISQVIEDCSETTRT